VVTAVIADLTVASGCGQLKSGAPARGERVEKYNRLLQIAHHRCRHMAHPPPQDRTPAGDPAARRPNVLVLDSLDMLVTSDPVAELDAALARATLRLHEARAAGRTQVAEMPAAWIDIRLDERLAFRDIER
jgi:hypothetical protein